MPAGAAIVEPRRTGFTGRLSVSAESATNGSEYQSFQAVQGLFNTATVATKRKILVG